MRWLVALLLGVAVGCARQVRAGPESDNIAALPIFVALDKGYFDGSMGTERPGRLTPAWITVLRDEADRIRDYADLRGKRIEAGAEGTPLDLLAREAARQGGLTPGKDVELLYRVRRSTAPMANGPPNCSAGRPSG